MKKTSTVANNLGEKSLLRTTSTMLLNGKLDFNFVQFLCTAPWYRALFHTDRISFLCMTRQPYAKTPFVPSSTIMRLDTKYII